jgi:cation transport ATPase
VGQQLNDKDVERIASRVVQKLVVYAVVIIGAIFVAPVFLMALITTATHFTSGLPFVVAVVISASIIAAPVVALIWLWGRARA